MDQTTSTIQSGLLTSGGAPSLRHPGLTITTGVKNSGDRRADPSAKRVVLDTGRYTSGRIAITNLSLSIDDLERRRTDGATFNDLLALSNLLFLRGDMLGRIADHDRAERFASEAVGVSPDAASALFVRARVAGRFRRFDDAGTLLDLALRAGYPGREIDVERAALLQATGRCVEALWLRKQLAKGDPGIQTQGKLATLLAEMNRWTEAETAYATALDADTGDSPFGCGQLLFEWGVSAMRCGQLDQAEAVLRTLEAILPQHVPARGHRAELALARGQSAVALALITPLVGISDDPKHRATYAKILAARGDHEAAAREAARAAAAYERLLARRPEAYADDAAAFFMGIGRGLHCAVELTMLNSQLRNTPCSPGLLAKALRNAEQVA